MKRVIMTVAAILLMTTLCVILFACVPGSIDKAKEKMTNAEYVCTVTTVGLAEGADGMLTAIKGEDMLYAVHFESSSKAKEFYSANKGNMGLTKAALGEGADLEYGQSGSWVYEGTAAAVKAFK